ncbi:TRP-domain-containing protein [Stipitochalara longipes BDJ]|nr:TRP-domain-containing protein [Stipitochalara longipes BDJ]
MARFPLSSASWATAFVSSLAILNTIIPAQAQSTATSGSTSSSTDPGLDTISGTNAQGVTQELLVGRYPALYTGDFGDCMGGQSLLNLTSFDAAYYADNMTVIFNLAGSTNLRNETVMLYISVDAYGEQRFEQVFNPCSANFYTLCPMNSSIPITGGAVIPVAQSDVSGIPNIALSIPDFEGSAYLRIFSNSSQTQIACFSAVMRNGASFSHPAAIGSVLGVFTVVALLASFATAIYGISVPHIRTHYAHSLSVLVVMEVFQSIFFSGALSLNWPSVCAAFWSNFAWSAGMIYVPSIMNSLNSFTGVSGNGSQVGGAGSTVINNNGGLQQQIYGRSLEERSSLAAKSELIASGIYKRAVNKTASSLEYAWAGVPVQPGLPLPGNWSGFAGELSLVNVPASDAFLTGAIWFSILLAILIGATAAFKWALEGLSSMKWIKHDRLVLFRSHWLGFLGLVILRSCFIAFFMMMTLTLYQFSYGGKLGPLIVAIIVFAIFFLGAIGLATYACFYRVKFGKYESSPDRIHFQRGKALKFIPWYRTVRESSMEEGDKAKSAGSVSFFQVRFVDNDGEIQNVHENADFTKRFGWLSARYRRTRWWFFAFWVVYQIGRACFIGGAQASPTAQVFGILAWELIAFVAIIAINPFEGARNTALAVYMLGISKVATAGLSVAFLPQFNLARIPTTVIGVIIIVIQGFLVVGLLILIVLGAISSYMSITRNQEEFKPYRLENIRMKYFGHLEQKEKDVPPPPPPIPEEPKEPYFQVKAVRRAPKIEDEDVDYVPEMNDFNPNASQYSVAGPIVNRMSRTNSLANSMRSHVSGYGNVPYGARVHRASWSSRDFQNWQDDESFRADSPFGMPSRSTSAADHHPHNSITLAPLVRPSPSHGSMRPSTPTREQQRQYANQRINRAN